jgi:glyoxalase family protein
MLRLDPTQPQSLVFFDPEGHEVELMVSDTPDAPLLADADDIPAEHRIRGIEGARSYTTLEEQLPFAAHLGFRADGTRLVLDGERSGRWYFSAPTGRPSGDGRVGVWHHIAYDAGDGAEVQRARDEADAGVRPWTRIFDHYFFDSCYTMSPGGRMEICTTGPGFQLDEQLEDLGDRLCLSPRVEPLRAKLEAELTPLVNPRPRTKGKGLDRVPAAVEQDRLVGEVAVGDDGGDQVGDLLGTAETADR